MSYDTTRMRIIYIYLCRYPHTVDGDSGSTIYTVADKACRMDSTSDFARYMQVSNGNIACIAKKST